MAQNNDDLALLPARSWIDKRFAKGYKNGYTIILFFVIVGFFLGLLLSYFFSNLDLSTRFAIAIVCGGLLGSQCLYVIHDGSKGETREVGLPTVFGIQRRINLGQSADGVLNGLGTALQPGLYGMLPRFLLGGIHTLDARNKTEKFSFVGILTDEGIALRITGNITYRVLNPYAVLLVGNPNEYIFGKAEGITRGLVGAASVIFKSENATATQSDQATEEQASAVATAVQVASSNAQLSIAILQGIDNEELLKSVANQIRLGKEVTEDIKDVLRDGLAAFAKRNGFEIDSFDITGIDLPEDIEGDLKAKARESTQRGAELAHVQTTALIGEALKEQFPEVSDEQLLAAAQATQGDREIIDVRGGGDFAKGAAIGRKQKNGGKK